MRLFQRRQFIRLFPAAAERLVQRDVLHHDRFLRDGVLILDRKFLPLGVEHVQEVRQTAFRSARWQAQPRASNAPSATDSSRRRCCSGPELLDGFVHLFHREENGLLVSDERLMRLQFLNIDQRVEPPEVEQGPITGGARRPDRITDCGRLPVVLPPWSYQPAVKRRMETNLAVATPIRAVAAAKARSA